MVWNNKECFATLIVNNTVVNRAAQEGHARIVRKLIPVSIVTEKESYAFRLAAEKFLKLRKGTVFYRVNTFALYHFELTQTIARTLDMRNVCASYFQTQI